MSINERVLELVVRVTHDFVISMGVKLDVSSQVGQTCISYFDDDCLLWFRWLLKINIRDFILQLWAYRNISLKKRHSATVARALHHDTD